MKKDEVEENDEKGTSPFFFWKNMTVIDNICILGQKDETQSL